MHAGIAIQTFGCARFGQEEGMDLTCLGQPRAQRPGGHAGTTDLVGGASTVGGPELPTGLMFGVDTAGAGDLERPGPVPSWLSDPAHGVCRGRCPEYLG